MALNKIYYGSFYDRLDTKIDVEIKQEDFSGEPSVLSFDVNPVVITTSNKEFTNTIFSTGCQLNLYVDTFNISKYVSLYGTPENENYLVVYKDPSIVLFEGYIIPDIYKQTLKANSKITITANNGIPFLESTELDQTQTLYPAQWLNIGCASGGLVRDAIYSTNLKNDIAVKNSLSSYWYVKDASSTILDISFVYKNLFIKDYVSDSAYTVLDSILRTFYSRLYYSNNKWYIDRIYDMGGDYNTYVNYTFDNNATLFYGDNNVHINDCQFLSYPNIEYETGKKKVILELEYKPPTNILSPFIWDASQAIDNSYPDYYEWMIDTSVVGGTPSTPLVSVAQYSDANIIYGANIVRTNMNVTAASMKKMKLCTRFPVSNIDQNVINIGFTISLIDQVYTSSYNYMAAYQLRASDNDGNNIYLLKQEDDTFIWTDVHQEDCIIKNIFTHDQFSTTKSITVNDSWDLTSVLDGSTAIPYLTVVGKKMVGIGWLGMGMKVVVDNIGIINKKFLIKSLYLDIFPLTYSTASSSFSYLTAAVCTTRFCIGDIKVGLDLFEEPNIMEGTLNEDYHNNLELKLKIFDAENSLYQNSLFCITENNEIIKTEHYTDDAVEEYLYIQELLIQNLIQQYHKPRYKLTADILASDSSVFNMGQVFTFDSIIYPDTSTIKFIPTGMEYNVINNSYRLNLAEYVNDDLYRAEGRQLDVVDDPHIYISPDTITYTYTGTACDTNYFDISTNTTWQVYGYSWLTITPMSGDGNTRVYVDINTLNSAGQSAYVGVIATGLDPLSVFVEQLEEGLGCP